MKTILIITATLFALVAQAQTKKIAHKSHSGSNNSFIAANYIDNIGLPSYGIDSIAIINDTTIVEYCSRYSGGATKKDTIKYKKELFILDSIERRNDTVKYIHKREFMTLRKEVDTILSNSYNGGGRLNNMYPGYFNGVKRINYKDSLEGVSIDTMTKKQQIPIINDYISPNKNEKNYNTNALKNFIGIGVAFVILSIVMMFLFFKNRIHA